MSITALQDKTILLHVWYRIYRVSEKTGNTLFYHAFFEFVMKIKMVFLCLNDFKHFGQVNEGQGSNFMFLEKVTLKLTGTAGKFTCSKLDTTCWGCFHNDGHCSTYPKHMLKFDQKISIRIIKV